MNATLNETLPGLDCLGFETGRDGAVTVHVKRPGEMFGLTLAQALRRIDDFNDADQGQILRALPDFYDIPRASARRARKSKHTSKEVA